MSETVGDFLCFLYFVKTFQTESFPPASTIFQLFKEKNCSHTRAQFLSLMLAAFPSRARKSTTFINTLQVNYFHFAVLSATSVLNARNPQKLENWTFGHSDIKHIPICETGIIVL